ncbi:hypothetical protein ACEQPO_07685 [Bacillus sp. SL00103]
MTTEVNETVQLIQKLVSILSPSGNTEKVIGLLNAFKDVNIETKRNRKGGLIATIKGTDDKEHRMLTAHVDTLVRW